MANFKNLANELNTNIGSLKSDYDNINTSITNLKGNFSGESSTKLCNDFLKTLEDLKSQMELVNSLSNTLNLIENHDSNVKTLNEYKNYKNNWSPSPSKTNQTSQNKTTQTKTTQTNPYTSKVEAYQKIVSGIEKDITSSLPNVSKISNMVTLITPAIDFSYKNYIQAASTAINPVSGIYLSNVTYQDLLNLAVNDWEQGFKNNAYGLRYSLLKNGYTTEEFDNIIASRMSGANTREKAVIAMLSVIDLGLQKGIISKYELSTNFFNSTHKPYDTESLLNHGGDCASTISWALNKATNNGFNNSSTDTIASLGEKTNYENLQEGDVIKNSGHIAMVISNNISNNDGYLVVADASSVDTGGYPAGIRIQKIKYNHLVDNNFQGYDMSNFYGQNI